MKETVPSSGKKDKSTFKAKTKRSDGGREAELLKHKRATATLGSSRLAAAVKLPEGEDQNEWIAINGQTLRIAGLPDGDGQLNLQ
jgi:hypothetical protein